MIQILGVKVIGACVPQCTMGPRAIEVASGYLFTTCAMLEI